MPDALTLSEVRSAVLSEADWAPTQSDEFLADLDRFIWQGALRLVSLVPGLLHDRETIYLQPPAKFGAVASDRVSVVSGDRLVLERPTTSASRTPWVQDGRWDSRNLLVQDSAGTYYSFVAHEWWTDSDGLAPTGNERVSLNKPYPVSSSDDMKWWVFTDPYALRDDVASVVEASVWDPETAQTFPLRGITEREMDALWRPGPPTASSGRPTHWSMGPRRRRRPPNWTPQVTNTGAWDAGGADTGRRRYRVTVCWGRRDVADLDPHGNMTPVWESPPSAASAWITATAGGGGAISITLPKMDYIAHYTGIPAAGSAREGRSGYFLRLYEQQGTDTETTPVDELAGYYLLAEVDANVGVYAHTGLVQRVYEVPLRPNQDIPTFRVWPHPSKRYEVRLRVVRRPTPFYVATEMVPIPPDASELLILDARRRLANKMQRADIAAALEAELLRRANDVNRANLIHAGVALERGACDALPGPRLRDPSDLEYVWLAHHLTS